MEILIPVLTLGLLGLLFGMVLAIASRRLTVRVDERLEKIHAILPGTNCGVCGRAGCFGFAQALLSGQALVTQCRVSEEAVKGQILRLLGKGAQNQIKMIAALNCGGGVKVNDKYLYRGLRDCVAANLILAGQKECFYGCLGFASCVKACPFEAIRMSEEGLPVVDKDKCKACNKCVLTCPKKLFTLIPLENKVFVACSAHDLGKETEVVCSAGCIACGLCAGVCKFDAIHVIDNLAVIDYNKCTSCGDCVKACPAKTIRIR